MGYRTGGKDNISTDVNNGHWSCYAVHLSMY